jgi:GDP-L-fucose synthase
MNHFSYQDIGEFVNIGTGLDIKINNLAKTIKMITRYGGEIRYDPSKPDGTPQKRLDISQIKKLGWRPEVTLKEGIQKSYQWYLKQK